jgi:DNA-3-methyladenine glycosylase II
MFILRNVPQPFSFHDTCSILLGEPEGNPTESYDGKTYRRVLRIQDWAFLIEVDANLGVSVSPECNGSQQSELERKLRWILDLDHDISGFYSAVKSDKVMSSLTKQLRGMRALSAATPFEGLVYSIIEQQISYRASRKITYRVIAEFGEPLGEYRAFPTAGSLANATAQELRNCGLSFRKAEYIKNAAECVVSGDLDLDAMLGMPDDEVMGELVKLPGIGRWTAEYCMVRGMRKHNSIPADDLEVRRLILHYYLDGEKIDGKTARKVAQNWEPYKGMAIYYLIVAHRRGLRA